MNNSTKKMTPSLFEEIDVKEISETVPANEEKELKKIDASLALPSVDLSEDLKEDLNTLFPVELYQTVKGEAIVSNNVLFSISSEMTSLQSSTFWRMMYFMQGWLSSTDEATKANCNFPRHFVVKASAIDVNHTKRVKEELLKLDTKSVRFRYKLPYTLKNGKDAYGVSGMPMVSITHYDEKSDDIHIVINPYIVPFIRYTGPSTEGKVIGSSKVPIEKVLKTKGQNNQKLLALLLKDNIIYSREYVICRITTLYEQLYIPEDRKKVSYLTERIIEPFIKFCKKAHEITFTYKLIDKNKNTIVPKQGKTEVVGIMFSIDKEQSVNIYKEEAVGAAFADYNTKTALKLQEDPWFYIKDQVDLNILYGELEKLKEKVKIGKGKSSVHRYNIDSCFNNFFQKMVMKQKEEQSKSDKAKTSAE